MALEAGVIVLTLEYADGLKDVQWFGRQDPYCRVIIGNQEFKSRTANSGGKTPVWNETFRFNVINENSFTVIVKDDNMVHDDMIGRGDGSLARARVAGCDTLKIPIMGKEHQHGFVQVTLRFEKNSALQAPQMGVPVPAAPYYPPPQPQYAAPPPAYYPPPQQPQYYAPPPQQFGPPIPYPPAPVVYAATPQVIYTPPPAPVMYVQPPAPTTVVYLSGHHHHRHGFY